jgi:hypothetical protein
MKGPRAASSIPLNQLKEKELWDAIHGAIGRKTIPASALGHIEIDIRRGVLAIDQIDWSSVWNRAAQLALLHTSKTLCSGKP